MNKRLATCFSLVMVTLLAVVAMGQTKSSKDAEDPIEARRKIIDKHLTIVKAVPSDAKVLTQEQVSAIDVLATYRAEQAVPELLRVITAVSPIELIPIGGASTYGARRQSGGDHVAAAALCKIGLPSVRAIVDDVVMSGDKVPQKDRLDLYAQTIMGLFPGSVGMDYVRERQRSAPAKQKQLYEPLLQAMEHHRPPVIQFNDDERVQARQMTNDEFKMTNE